MKTYRTLRPVVIGDTRHDKGVVIELIDKQAAALLAAGHVEAAVAAAPAPAPESAAKPSTKSKVKEAAE